MSESQVPRSWPQQFFLEKLVDAHMCLACPPGSAYPR